MRANEGKANETDRVGKSERKRQRKRERKRREEEKSARRRKLNGKISRANCDIDPLVGIVNH